MFPAAYLLSYLLVAVSLTGILASPVTGESAQVLTLPIKARFAASDGLGLNIMKRDAARREARKAHLQARKTKRWDFATDVAATNTLVSLELFHVPCVIFTEYLVEDGYTVEVGISSPATNYNILWRSENA